MKHPNPEMQKNQADFLKQCPEDQKEFHARLFRIGNASCIYHGLAASPNDSALKSYYQEWLEGLPDPIRKDMEAQGFEQCKAMFPFTRYVNEREDIGMDAWMKEHLSEEDYSFYINKQDESSNNDVVQFS